MSLLPLSHLLEQEVGLFYAISVGADVLYVRSRNPRVIFDALRDHKVTSMVVVPQVLDLFWSAITREVDKRGKTAAFDRLRGIARHLPMAVRRAMFGSVHKQLGGHFQSVRLGRRLPAAGAPAGLGGPRGHRHAGLRRQRDRHRDLHHAQGPRSRDGRAAAGRDPGPDRVRTARSSSPARPSSRATGRTPKPRPPPSPTTAGTRAATSATSTTPDA